MWSKLKRAGEAFGVIASVPERLSQEIEEAKASPTGRRVIALDEKAGRFVCRTKAALWLVAGVPVAGVGYAAYALTGGWLQTGLLAICGMVLLYIVTCAVVLVSRPQSASEIVVDELQDRVKPARWIAWAAGALLGKRRSAAE